MKSPMEEPLEESPAPRKNEVSVARYTKKKKKKKKKTKKKKKKIKPTTKKGTAPEPVASESTKDSTVLNSLLVDAAIQRSEIIHVSSAHTFINMVDVKFDGGGKVYFVVKPEKEVMNDVEVQKTEELLLGVTNPTKEWTRLYVKEIEYDSDGDEIPDGDCSDDEVEEEADHTEPMGPMDLTYHC